MSDDVTIYTDGACLGNPGPGGYGVVILNGDERKELSGGYRQTTNNRMELMAAIVGLGSLKSASRVKLYSDSRYLVDAMNQGWVLKWKSKNWKRSGGAVPNSDLWKQLLSLNEKHAVSYNWVEGHAGNRENERCDRLSVQAAKGRNLPQDTGYESAKTVQGSLFG